MESIIDENYTINWKNAIIFNFNDPLRYLIDSEMFRKKIDTGNCHTTYVFSSQRNMDIFYSFIDLTCESSVIFISCETYNKKYIPNGFSFSLYFDFELSSSELSDSEKQSESDVTCDSKESPQKLYDKNKYHIDFIYLDDVIIFSEFYTIDGTSEIVLHQSSSFRKEIESDEIEEKKIFDVTKLKILNFIPTFDIKKINSSYYSHYNNKITIHRPHDESNFNLIIDTLFPTKPNNASDFKLNMSRGYVRYDLYSKEKYDLYYELVGFNVKCENNALFRLIKHEPKNYSDYNIDRYEIWNPKMNEHYFVIEFNKNIYFANIETLEIIRVTENENFSEPISWYISNNNVLILNNVVINKNYNKKYLNSKYQNKTMSRQRSYSFSSLSECKRKKFTGYVYFNDNDKPCKYIKCIGDGYDSYRDRNILMKVGHTKTWFLCSLLLFY